MSGIDGTTAESATPTHVIVDDVISVDLTTLNDGLFTGTVRRWELIPFVVAIILLFLGGLTAIRRYYDERDRDNQARIEQICASGEKNRTALHELFLDGVRERGGTEEEVANTKQFLDDHFPIQQPCGDDQTPATTVP